MSPRPDPFRTLLDDSACRMEALSSIGQQLRRHYAEQLSAPLPEHLQTQLRQLARVERRSTDN
jgi:hypothetical protein